MIHIAGTNGKGSVCAWLSSLFEVKGKRVALFSSPHLVSHLERYRINGENMPLSDWQRLYQKYRDVIEGNDMTMFELDLFLAMAWFSEQEPDVILMETGMGGRRDATTALSYDADVITNIGLDHTAFLGNTIEEIAYEKAGILEAGVPAATGLMEPSAFEVIQKEAERKNVPLFPSENALEPEAEQLMEEKGLPDYQKENLNTALAVFRALGIAVQEVEVLEAIKRFEWKGRFEVLRRDPLLVADGAHNLHGISALADSIFPGEFDICYFSVLADKQGEKMIQKLQEKIRKIVLVTFDSYRLADVEEIAARLGLELVSFEKMMDSLHETEKKALLCGSLYFVGDVLAAWKK